MKLERNIAYDVRLIFVDKGELEVNDNENHHNMSAGDNFKELIKFPLELQPVYFIIDLIYDDILGNRYKQRFNYWPDKFNASAPQQIRVKN